MAEIPGVRLPMHRAEGPLSRDALRAAASRLGLPVIGIREKELEALADKALSLFAAQLDESLCSLGKRAGRPWASDREPAARAAWIALRSVAR